MLCVEQEKTTILGAIRHPHKMKQNPQLLRYKALLSYIEDHLSEEINIEKVEEICHYSYRNINRIFEAIHQETIGKYIKRLRLEKAAQYLKYSSLGVSQIAYEVGFEDRSAFSKAFKSKYHLSPLAFREDSESILEQQLQILLPNDDQERQKLKFDIQYLPNFDYLFIEYRGDYENAPAIENAWRSLLEYAEEKELLSDRSVFMTEIIDDAEISDHINSRYNQALVLEKPLEIEPEALFRSKKHLRQKYAKFSHQGSHQSRFDLYNKIYAFWMLDAGLELADMPIIELYPNFDERFPENQQLTDIYIPLS